MIRFCHWEPPRKTLSPRQTRRTGHPTQCLSGKLWGQGAHWRVQLPGPACLNDFRIPQMRGSETRNAFFTCSVTGTDWKISVEIQFRHKRELKTLKPGEADFLVNVHITNTPSLSCKSTWLMHKRAQNPWGYKTKSWTPATSGSHKLC